MPHVHPIVAAARSWIGTRFHHQGRLKKTAAHKGGVDCLGLLAGVAGELGLPEASADETDYSHRPDTARLRKRLSELLAEIPQERMSIGDIVLLNVDGQPQHLAIISGLPTSFPSPACGRGQGEGASNNLGIIHAYAPARAVVEHHLDDWWRARIAAAFRLISPDGRYESGAFHGK